MRFTTRPIVGVATLLLAVLPTRAPAMLESRLLYFPSHDVLATDLDAWREDGKLIGYGKATPSPRRVWLMLHGNAGQASGRGYIRDVLPPGDAFYVLEYPGYGRREGSPSLVSIHAAAEEALGHLQNRYPNTSIGVIGESLGSGPASHLGTVRHPPDRIVLIVPFDTLISVAKGHYPFLPVGLLLRDKWDNARSLAHYGGRIDIFAAKHDRIIPVQHARRLAEALPKARYHELDCGHNDWSSAGLRIPAD